MLQGSCGAHWNWRRQGHGTPGPSRHRTQSGNPSMGGQGGKKLRGGKRAGVEDILVLFFFFKDFIYLFFERGEGREEERERNIAVREKHRSVASRAHPNQGPNPQPRLMP